MRGGVQQRADCTERCEEVLFGGLIAEGKTDRALRKSTQGPMRIGGAVQTDTGHDSKIALQQVGDFTVVETDIRKIQRYNADLFRRSGRARDVHRKSIQFIQKQFRERTLPFAESGNSRLQQIVQSGVQAENAGKVDGAGFKAVRHIAGLQLAVGGRAGTARHEGTEPFGKRGIQQQGTDALGAQKPLVAGDGKGGQMQLCKIDVMMAGGLGGVDSQGDSGAVTELCRLVERDEGPLFNADGSANCRYRTGERNDRDTYIISHNMEL